MRMVEIKLTGITNLKELYLFGWPVRIASGSANMSFCVACGVCVRLCPLNTCSLCHHRKRRTRGDALCSRDDQSPCPYLWDAPVRDLGRGGLYRGSRLYLYFCRGVYRSRGYGRFPSPDCTRDRALCYDHQILYLSRALLRGPCNNGRPFPCGRRQCAHRACFPYTRDSLGLCRYRTCGIAIHLRAFGPANH